MLDNILGLGKGYREKAGIYSVHRAPYSCHLLWDELRKVVLCLSSNSTPLFLYPVKLT